MQKPVFDSVWFKVGGVALVLLFLAIINLPERAGAMMSGGITSGSGGGMSGDMGGGMTGGSGSGMGSGMTGGSSGGMGMGSGSDNGGGMSGQTPAGSSMMRGSGQGTANDRAHPGNTTSTEPKD